MEDGGLVWDPEGDTGVPSTGDENPLHSVFWKKTL